MHSVAAIIFDFDGVVADCHRHTLLPGAAAFVALAAQAVPIAIASGAMTSEIQGLLAEHGLDHAFTAIVGADQTARSKPSPDPYLEALHRIAAAGHRVDAWRTVAIDDSVWGLVAARTARLRAVGVARDERRSELAPYAELVVPGLDGLTLATLDTLVRAVPGRPAG